jgi:hypothetical protein
MTKFAHDCAEGVAGRRQPVLMAGSSRAGAPFDESVILQFAQPRNQHRARYQRHAAMDVVERVNVGHQLAQDERRPARGKHFRCFRDRTKLIVANVHSGN